MHEIYTCHMLQAFFKAFDATGYAVLSRKLGICLSGNRYENYGDYDEKGDAEILAMLKEQVKNPEFEDTFFVYWNHRPLTHSKWVWKLAEAGFHVIERRTIAEIKDVIMKGSVQSLDAWTSGMAKEGLFYSS